MRYRRLRTAAYEASLQILKVIANTLEAHVDLFVETMEIGFGVRIHHLLVVIVVILRYVLGAWHISALVEISFTPRFICKFIQFNKKFNQFNNLFVYLLEVLAPICTQCPAWCDRS